MMPNALLASYTRTMHSERESLDLRRYARDEWAAQVHWIRKAVPTVPLRERLGHWLRRERPLATPARTVVGAIPSPPELVRASLPDEAPCPHVVQEDLGLGGTTAFLRCCVCGEVLVVSGRQVWGLRRSEPVAAPDPSPA